MQVGSRRQPHGNRTHSSAASRDRHRPTAPATTCKRTVCPVSFARFDPTGTATMCAKNVFYAQSGGVTAAINASAAGVIEAAREYPQQINRVYAGRNGIIGALTEDLIDTSAESAGAIAALRHTPAGAFGSARYKLKGLDENRAEYERLIEVFKAHDIGYFLYNGGGDSADTCLKVSQLADTM